MRYVCIHGHFYQPPRENPWLGMIERQDTAAPYHDWNERITAECYRPNAAARLINHEGRIAKIINNYSRMSFNVGPTLLAYLEVAASDVYQAILLADRESRERFSGHGSALAQAYGHAILPLATRRDKVTQIRWGIRDFQRRFGRSPEGMWLPETAVDLESLQILAEAGLRFAILAPRQARRVRQTGSDAWQDVSERRIDPTMAYRLDTHSGRSIVIFFRDSLISRAVAFEGVLGSGEEFLHRLFGGFSDDRPHPQLMHIATDGETYGHHQRQGEMALAYALDAIESGEGTQLTNYGEFLERHPPTHLVEIAEHTSWSCEHGVERWRSNCGCNSGMHPGWNQGWRTPLREALDWLRDTLAPLYEAQAVRFLRDPWAARDEYIEVILDRSPENLQRFLAEHAARGLDEGELITALKLLELQRHALLMFTSDGWFFDDLSGIETVQVLRYACRAIELAEGLFGDHSLESGFLERLERARSNIPEQGDGARIYETLVKPAMIDLEGVGAHYATRSLFERPGEQTKVYAFTVERQDHRSLEAGQAKLAIGVAQVTSEMTRETAALSFGVLHAGGLDVRGGVRLFAGHDGYQAAAREISEAFSRADLPRVIRLLNDHFGGRTFTLASLVGDERQRILRSIGAPLPATVTFVLHTDLRRALEGDVLDPARIAALLGEAERFRVTLDAADLSKAAAAALERKMQRLRAVPTDLALLQEAEAAAGLLASPPFTPNLWVVQNLFYEMLQTAYPSVRDRAEQGDEIAEAWVGHFIALGDRLSMQVG
jgi:alpha-amylase/alpha-mannosidase (GH57 family)